MRIKRFRAHDMKTVIKMVRDELGPEAVILSTREDRASNETGPFVEVTAGIGFHSPPTPAVARAAPPAKAEAPDPAAGANVEKELAEIKALLLDLTHRSMLSERLRDRRDLVRVYRDLLDADLDSSLARLLLEKVAAQSNGDGGQIRSRLTTKLAGLLQAKDTLAEASRTGARTVALVGPSGVGKTTTVAKLAAIASAKRQKKVALISLDVYRLGAAEQLRTYAHIMGLPLKVVQDKEEFKAALDLFEDMDAVLIDTASRSLVSPDALSELADILELAPGLSVILVLSATTKDRDLSTAIERVRNLPVDSLIITKIDETERYGNVINNLLKFKMPVSFLTTGQKVPDDIVPASPGRLAELITAIHRAE